MYMCTASTKKTRLVLRVDLPHFATSPYIGARRFRCATNCVPYLKHAMKTYKMILDCDQLDAHLLHFTIRPLKSSTCFEHYVLIIRRLNVIDAASGIVLSVIGRPVHRLRESWLEWLTPTSSLSTCAPDGHWLRGRYEMHQYNSTSWWWACNARNM